MGTVNQWKWVNQFQPQTLYMATILCYVDAVFGLLFGGVFLLNLLIVGCLGAGAFGIANEKKWGYGLGLLMAFLPFILRLIFLHNPFATQIIDLMFEVALVCLLLHPQSREYQRIWFK